MSRTITAMFDSRSEAEAARIRLSQSRIDADDVKIIDQSSGNESGGFWASLKEAFLPDEDSDAYDEGMRRGGFLLCAEVDEDQADEAIALLDESNSVDFDQRQQEWRNEGWTGYGGPTGGGFDRGQQGFGQPGGSETFGRENTVEEERIPIVEEQLKVGKREVGRGGARVRSYVRETPVHEQVNLREEHVSVERRPVDQPLAAGDLNSPEFLRDREIEMTETSEEAVVAKEARVREELVVKKTTEQRTEDIDDTVRQTEVEVDEADRGPSDRSAFGGFGSGSGNQDETIRSDFERTDRKF